MNTIDAFYISGKKDLLFRREDDLYINFDPVNLESIKLNISGAKIMFLISQNFKYNQIIDFLTEDYGAEEEKTKGIVSDFIENYKCKEHIIDKLNELNFKANGEYELA